MVTRRLVQFTYGLLGFCLILGFVVLHFDVRFALLPIAFIFGWAQIGGL
jgi:hypothetical protein